MFNKNKNTSDLSSFFCNTFQLGLTILGLMLLCLQTCHAAPRIVVTLKPIHSLVASLTQGVTSPQLLLPDGASPHTFALKPSQLKQIQQADLIIWVGPELEQFMIKPVQQAHPSWGKIRLMDLPLLQLLPQRHGRIWQAHAGHDHHGHEHGHRNEVGNGHEHKHAQDEVEVNDPHFWLSTSNAQIIVDHLANYLSHKDPANAKHYLNNAKALKAQLFQLKKTIQKKLHKAHGKPFLVYHDGYQYFEKEFDLQAAGTLVLNPHLPLSAKGLRQIQNLIKDKKVYCVFHETEFNDTMVRRVLSQLPVQISELDPLGVHQAPGVGNYEKTMLALADTFGTCLSK